MNRFGLLALLYLFYICTAIADDEYHYRFNKVNNEDMYVYVLFGFDNNKLTNEDENNIKKVIQYIKTIEDYRLVLIGHTDEIGTPNYNINLANERVDVVLNYLMNIQHIPEDKIILKNRNEFDPAATNDSEQGRWRNRRVDIYVQKLSM